MRRLLVLSTLFLAFQTHAEIYKCKNENGTITYQATICATGAVSTVKKPSDIPLEEQKRAQERTRNMAEANRQKETARALELQRRNDAIVKYDTQKKNEELERRKEAHDRYKEQLLRRQTLAAERAAAAAELAAATTPAKSTLHCRPDYAGGMYCN